MLPSLVITKQVENYKIWKEDEKNHLQNQGKQESPKKKKHPRAQVQVPFGT
jgi:hypothetical protein